MPSWKLDHSSDLVADLVARVSRWRNGDRVAQFQTGFFDEMVGHDAGTAVLHLLHRVARITRDPLQRQQWMIAQKGLGGIQSHDHDIVLANDGWAFGAMC